MNLRSLKSVEKMLRDNGRGRVGDLAATSINNRKLDWNRSMNNKCSFFSGTTCADEDLVERRRLLTRRRIDGQTAVLLAVQFEAFQFRCSTNYRPLNPPACGKNRKRIKPGPERTRTCSLVPYCRPIAHADGLVTNMSDGRCRMSSW